MNINLLTRYESKGKGYVIASHGFHGFAIAIADPDRLNRIAKRAKDSGKKYIKLLVCEAGQHGEPGKKPILHEGNKNIVERLWELTKMPIKYTEDYVTFPIFSSEPTTSESDSAKIHGWQWYNGKK